ncbi:MAG: hypothetical protein KC944_20865, partial [Candidatus Omnitrophica bacterium]|nr:hypothetical protein [Candidatus Omnitrophota bacterium]
MVSKTGDGTNGLTWPTAFQEIGAAITASSTGDEIWVKGGRYVENLTTTSPITLLGGFEGTEEIDERDLRDPDENPTIIDGNKLGSVLVVNHDLQVDGLTITKGIGTGAGIKVVNSRLELTHAHLLSNGNKEDTFRGGGIYAGRSMLIIRDCIVEENVASNSGGGIFILDSSLHLKDSIIRNNRSGFFGGGISGGNANISVENVLFHHNTANRFVGGPGQIADSCGGAIYCDLSNGSCNNSIFSDNSSRRGSDIYVNNLEQNSWTVSHCTIYTVSRIESTSSFSWNENPPTLTNCIAVGREGDIFRQADTVNVRYSLIEGGYPGEGNIDANPMFVDPDHGD